MLLDSCHLDMPLNIELSVKYRMNSIVVFLNVAMKFLLGHLKITGLQEGTLPSRMFGVGGLFMKYAYVPEGGNEGGKVATPTSFSILDSCDMKSL